MIAKKLWAGNAHIASRGEIDEASGPRVAEEGRRHRWTYLPDWSGGLGPGPWTPGTRLSASARSADECDLVDCGDSGVPGVAAVVRLGGIRAL